MVINTVNNEWITGFVLASRLYYRFGHLDYKPGSKIINGFDIGEWLQWNRDNAGSLAIYQLNDLTTYGMIWNAESMGRHSKIYRNIEKMKSYRNIDGILDVAKIEKNDPDLHKWMQLLPEFRRLNDNAFLTLREIDMLSEIGYNWPGRWPSRVVEDAARREKVEWLTDKLRIAYMDNTTVVTKVVEKPVVKVERVKTPVGKEKIVTKVVEKEREQLWYEKFICAYMLRSNIEVAFKDALREIENNTILSDKTKSLLKLGFGNNLENLSYWIGNNNRQIKNMDLTVALASLNTYLEYAYKLNISIDKIDSNALTFNGYNIAYVIANIVTKANQENLFKYPYVNEMFLELFCKKKLSAKQLAEKYITYSDSGVSKNDIITLITDLRAMRDEKEALEKVQKRNEIQGKKKEIQLKEKVDKKFNDKLALLNENFNKLKNELLNLEKDTEEYKQLELRVKFYASLVAEKNTKFTGYASDFIDLTDIQSLRKAVKSIKEYCEKSDICPWKADEALDDNIKRIILSLDAIGKQFFSDEDLVKLNGCGFIFTDADRETLDSIYEIRKAFNKVMSKFNKSGPFAVKDKSIINNKTYLFMAKTEQEKEKYRSTIIEKISVEDRDVATFIEMVNSFNNKNELVNKMYDIVIKRILSKTYRRG